ncbi:MAG: ATP-grasp domain-containing protein [Oscillospiraceae bacterium]|nr:ATP-grasp domain-containing protein [Oscillospiraceae bacterium]
MCSAGRRCELIKCIRASMSTGSIIVAADNSPYAPALYMADCAYTVPRIDDPSYIATLLQICQKEKIDVITTFIDPEIMLLAENRERFAALGALVLTPSTKTAALCFDKYQMFRFLREKGIRTPETWGSYQEAENAIHTGAAALPVFVKPRTGSGSVGAKRIEDLGSLKAAFEDNPTLIAQELMTGEGCVDLDADIYVDAVSGEIVSAFTKRKLATTIGGANKTVSFQDEKLLSFIREICGFFEFCGPIDADFFFKNGCYYLSEINPRFGGAYLHAYGAGVDFIQMIEQNLKGKANKPVFNNYEEGVVMMMYDSVVIAKPEQILR